MINSSWEEIKGFANDNSVPIRWVVASGKYWVKATNSDFSVYSQILITSPPSDDQQDFENNYKEASTGYSAIAVDTSIEIIDTQVLSIGATAQSSSAYGTTADSHFHVRVVGTADFHINIGTSPTATSSDCFISSRDSVIFRIPGGDSISIIQDSIAGVGSAYLTQVNFK